MPSSDGHQLGNATIVRSLSCESTRPASLDYFRLADHPPSDEPIPGVLSAMAIFSQQ